MALYRIGGTGFAEESLVFCERVSQVGRDVQLTTPLATLASGVSALSSSGSSWAAEGCSQLSFIDCTRFEPALRHTVGALDQTCEALLEDHGGSSLAGHWHRVSEERVGRATIPKVI